MASEIYWRIYLSSRNEKFTVVCMQNFDEYDYYQDKFMTDEYGDKLIFYTEKEAIGWLNENVKEEYIDSEYKNLKFNRNKYLK